MSKPNIYQVSLTLRRILKISNIVPMFKYLAFLCWQQQIDIEEIWTSQQCCKYLHIFNCFYLKMVFFVTVWDLSFENHHKKISIEIGKHKLSAYHHKAGNKLWVGVISRTHARLCWNSANIKRNKIPENMCEVKEETMDFETVIFWFCLQWLNSSFALWRCIKQFKRQNPNSHVSLGLSLRDAHSLSFSNFLVPNELRSHCIQHNTNTTYLVFKNHMRPKISSP